MVSKHYKTMKKSIQFITLVLVMLASANLASANSLNTVNITGDKTVITQDRPVASFHAIKVSGGIDVQLSQGNALKLQVEADENVISQIRTEVKDGVLNIYSEGNIRNPETMEVNLTFQQLDAISASGGCDIKSMQKLNFTTLKLDISGGCDVELNCKADKLVCKQSGGCDVELKGEAQKGTFNVSGGCDLKASEFYLKNCTVDASGGTDVSVYASGELTITATGASDVNYYGRPTKITKSAQGASDINAR
jgi:hypothetical protein